MPGKFESEAAPAVTPRVRLIDPAGRVLRKLRVSLTDACNYRCFYCMPKHPTFTPASQLLRPDEYRSICSALVARGMEELRLTGGEPTARPEFRAIVAALTEVLAARRSLTSNGQLLARHLDFLRDLGWTNVNISLDSLDAGSFARITGGGDFATVMACIEQAVAKGFQVKINAVIFKGVNDGELCDFARWSARTGIEVRFLEFMKIGPTYGENWRRFMSAEDMIAKLETFTELRPVPVPLDSPAFVFETGEGARLGFIASESQPFCGRCSRLRLSATGVLRACLMSEQGISLRGVAPDGIPDILHQVMAMKPQGRLDHVDQPMHAIGG